VIKLRDEDRAKGWHADDPRFLIRELRRHLKDSKAPEEHVKAVTQTQLLTDMDAHSSSQQSWPACEQLFEDTLKLFKFLGVTNSEIERMRGQFKTIDRSGFGPFAAFDTKVCLCHCFFAIF
jgi:hypothetical protein